MNPDLNHFSKKVKEIRKQLNLTQGEFAKKIGATVPAVSNWENGRNMPNKERLITIATLGDITVEMLIYGIVSVDEIYQEILSNENLTSVEKDFLIKIKDDFIPLLKERVKQYAKNQTNIREEMYIHDRITSLLRAYTDTATLNSFDETFNGYHFPTIKEDLEFFSNNIPYLKGKKYVYVNTNEKYQLLVKDQVEQSLKASYIIQSEKELQALEDTKSTFADIIKSYEEIEQLQYSDSVNQVYNANLDYQNSESDIRIYDGASYIDYLEFANRYFSELLDDSDIINEIGSRKQFSSDLNSQIAVDLFKNGIEKNILDNNKLIEQIQNNLNK